MKRRNNFKLICSTGLIAGILMTSQVSAQEVEITGKKCPIPILSAREEGEMVENVVECDRIEIFGKTPDGLMPIRYGDNQVGYVEYETLRDLLALPELENVEEHEYPEKIAKGEVGEHVSYLQEMLVAVGNPIKPDGHFGEKTRNAIIKVQKSLKMEATGVADLSFLLTLEGMTDTDRQGTVTAIYPPSRDPEQIFADIYGKTTADLKPLADQGWKLRYDGFDGLGEMSVSVHMGTYNNESTPVDRLALNAALGVRVENTDGDKVALYPVLRISTKGAASVYLQTVSLKRGSEAVALELYSSERVLDGLDLREEGIFKLTEEAMEILSNHEKGELSVRVNCQNAKYMLEGHDSDDDIAAFCDACGAAGLAGTR